MSKAAGGAAGSAAGSTAGAVAELRICKAILWTAWRLEWSYSKKSGIEFMARVY